MSSKLWVLATCELHWFDGWWLLLWMAQMCARTPLKALTDYYLFPLINVHYVWVCVFQLLRALWVGSTRSPCHKSINTIEVLILPSLWLWAICSFKSHLAKANLTFTDEDFDLSVLIFLFSYFRYLNDSWLLCSHLCWEIHKVKWKERKKINEWDYVVDFCLMVDMAVARPGASVSFWSLMQIKE